jgi:hypothetical protein
MARKLTFVPTTTAAGLITLDMIPEDVKSDVEESYAAMAANHGRIRAEFDTKEEADIFSRQAASYCTQRPQGALKFRRSPTKGLPDHVVDFTIKRDVEANGERRGESPTAEANKPK